MTFAAVDDLSVFINPDTPGYVSATLNAVAIGALFDAAYSASYGIDGSSPMIEVIDAAAIAACGVSKPENIPRGTAAVVNGTNYTVQGIEPDGTGLTRLTLEKA